MLSAGVKKPLFLWTKRLIFYTFAYLLRAENDARRRYKLFFVILQVFATNFAGIFLVKPLILLYNKRVLTRFE